MKDKVFLTGIFIIIAVLIPGLAGCPLEAENNTDAKIITITGTIMARIESVWVFSDLDFSNLNVSSLNITNQELVNMPDDAMAVGPNIPSTSGTEISLALFADKERLKAWKGNGSYYVVLVDNSSYYFSTLYIYTNGGELTADKSSFKKLEFNKRTVEVPLDQFKQVDPGLFP
jgi:hypothetical protein